MIKIRTSAILPQTIFIIIVKYHKSDAVFSCAEVILQWIRRSYDVTSCTKYCCKVWLSGVSHKEECLVVLDHHISAAIRWSLDIRYWIKLCVLLYMWVNWQLTVIVMTSSFLLLGSFIRTYHKTHRSELRAARRRQSKSRQFLLHTGMADRQVK